MLSTVVASVRSHCVNIFSIANELGSHVNLIVDFFYFNFFRSVRDSFLVSEHKRELSIVLNTCFFKSSFENLLKGILIVFHIKEFAFFWSELL
jgi:hypothetical protein